MMELNRAKLKKAALSCFAAIFLACCVGPLVPVSRIDDKTAQELAVAIPVYDAQQTPKAAAVIGPISATSCQNKLWDRAASQENAISQLRLYSRQRGGDGVGNLMCEAPAGTDLATNCWKSVTCSGTAIHSEQRATK